MRGWKSKADGGSNKRELGRSTSEEGRPADGACLVQLCEIRNRRVQVACGAEWAFKSSSDTMQVSPASWGPEAGLTSVRVRVLRDNAMSGTRGRKASKCGATFWSRGTAVHACSFLYLHALDQSVHFHNTMNAYMSLSQGKRTYRRTRQHMRTCRFRIIALALSGADA